MSKIKEEKMVKQEVTVGWQCDVCGKQTMSEEHYDQEWFGFNEEHCAWGSDSMDSFVWYEVCSVNCFIKNLQERLPHLSEYANREAEIAGMPVKFAQKLLDRLIEGKNE